MEHEKLITVSEENDFGWLFDELAKSLQAVLGVLKSFDNGENCPSCGEEYIEDFSCQNGEDCDLVQAENLLAKIGA